MKIGSLFSGYGGLDMAVRNVFGGDLAWWSDIEPASCKVMEAHHPDVPNLGDVKTVDWSQVEPIDILTGGYPCQPFSTAGKRKGTEDERHLFPYVAEAISVLRPSIVILENVRGHLSLGFDIVLGTLSKVGYDARWGVVRASDAGACHQRERLFIIAYSNSESLRQLRVGRMVGEERGNDSISGFGEELPTRSSGQDNADQIGSNSNAANPSGEGFQGRGIESGGVESQTRSSGYSAAMGGKGLDWKKYEPAIRRWEQLTRPAPNPTIQRNNRPRLNPIFVEWMMGLPEGHVTGHGLRASQELKMLGNGVVPQQAELAIRTLINE